MALNNSFDIYLQPKIPINVSGKLTEKTYYYSIFLIFAVGFLIVNYKPIEIVNDSLEYLNISINRSAGYPIFLHIIKTIFGSYFDPATKAIQYLLGVSGIYFFISTLKKHLNLDCIWLILLTFVLIIPYLYNQTLANVFLSEALSYPLYLTTTALFLNATISNRFKPLIISLPFLFLLIQTRSQFLFLVPIAIGILIWMFIVQKKLNNSWLLILFFIFPLLTSLGDKTYHKLVHGYFVNTPWTGIHLMTPAFFVSDAEDFSIYKSKDEQEFYKKTFSELAKKNLNIHSFQASSNKKDEVVVYTENYSEIANSTILPIGTDHVDQELSNEKKLISVDRMTKRMSIPLIINNFRPWLKLYIKNLTQAFGNAKYTLLLIIIMLFSFIKVLKTNIVEYRVIFIISMLSLLNVVLVSIGMHTLKRFTFYNDWVFFLIIFSLINSSTFNSLKPCK
ncbi:hypothetical protein BKM32_12660 [Mangrovimonas sp. DI 80]|nr:hypothetical protein BKM32_12660 [Mangrovimonas sp. DI 80]